MLSNTKDWWHCQRVKCWVHWILGKPRMKKIVAIIQWWKKLRLCLVANPETTHNFGVSHFQTGSNIEAHKHQENDGNIKENINMSKLKWHRLSANCCRCLEWAINPPPQKFGERSWQATFCEKRAKSNDKLFGSRSLGPHLWVERWNKLRYQHMMTKICGAITSDLGLWVARKSSLKILNIWPTYIICWARAVAEIWSAFCFSFRSKEVKFSKIQPASFRLILTPPTRFCFFFTKKALLFLKRSASFFPVFF